MRILTAMIQGRLMFDLVAGVAALLGLGVMLMTDAVGAHVNADADDHPLVELDTSLGPIVLELDRTRAPITVDNFLQYVDAGFYDNTIFHRVIPGFMIQGGGMDDAMREKPTNPPIRNEASNGLSNKRGTIAMARTNDPNSATAQFFINLVDNGSLNPRPGSAGYAVFGKVVSGMDVVDAIAQARTASRGPHDDVPVKPIYIKSARRKAKP